MTPFSPYQKGVCLFSSRQYAESDEQNMGKLLAAAAVLLLVIVGGCIGGTGTPDPGVEVENQIDHPVDVEVVLASPDSSIVVEYRNGTEVAYAPDEIQAQGLGDLDGAAVVSGEQYAMVSAEQGETARIDIDDYDSDSYIVAIVHRRGDPSTNFVVIQCDEGEPRISLTPGPNLISAQSSGCL